MNANFAQSRAFYLELAKLNGSWDMIRTCAANVHRILEKEKTTTLMVAIESTDEEWFLGWELN